MDWMSGYRLPSGSNGDLVESAIGGNGPGGLGNGSANGMINGGSNGMTSPLPTAPSPIMASPWGAGMPCTPPQVKQEAVSPSPQGHTSISAPGSIKGKIIVFIFL